MQFGYKMWGLTKLKVHAIVVLRVVVVAVVVDNDVSGCGIGGDYCNDDY